VVGGPRGCFRLVGNGVYERLAERREVVWFGVVNLNLSWAVKRRPC
jgi:hypothetical protein